MRIPRTSALESISQIAATVRQRSPHTVERARRIVGIIEREKFPMPFVFPTEIGGIQLEWKRDERELNLEILPQGDRLAFLMITRGTPTREGEIPETEREICSLLDWMVSA